MTIEFYTIFSVWRIFYFYKFGDDLLEILFSNLGTMNHGSKGSYSQLLNRLEHVIDIERIFDDHPSWKKVHRRDSHNLERVN